MSDLDSVPQKIEVGLEEIFPLVIDFTPNAATGETLLTTATAEFINRLTQTNIAATALQGPPNINGLLVQVIILATTLVSGQIYELRVTGTFGLNKRLTVNTDVWCRR